jgi:hypothetical protein
MKHESMVHALDEIRRTLKSNGILLDLRPVEDNWQLEVASSTGWQASGRVTDLPEAVADDEAAFRAMREAESRGWFIKNKEEEFPFFYYWDTPAEMKEFMETEWDDFEKLEEDAFKRTAAMWASANADARVRLRVRMLITQWDKRWNG